MTHDCPSGTHKTPFYGCYAHGCRCVGCTKKWRKYARERKKRGAEKAVTLTGDTFDMLQQEAGWRGLPCATTIHQLLEEAAGLKGSDSAS